MSTPRFTLGPWRTGQLVGSRLHIDSANWYSLAEVVVHVQGESDEEGYANAHLIAAAPRLFGIVRQYMASDERQGLTGTILYEQAKAAIEAATGEKS